MASRSSNRTIYAALCGNLLVALTKFLAAAWTGSSAMLSEGVHSLVDTGNQGLLLYGKWRAARPADDQNPLGHARELYFWGFVVALLIFSLGAGVSFYEGLVHLRHPTSIENPLVNYIVLGLSLVFEGVSWTVAFHEFDARRDDVDYIEAIMRSKDPSIFVVLLEDTAAVLGILIAFTGTVLSEWLSSPVFDGAASIGIAIVLGATAVFLARESKGLLIGEPASKEINGSILRLARKHRHIDTVRQVITVHLGPQDILAALTVDFANAASAKDLEGTMAELDRDIKERHPEVRTMFFKVDASA
jgi:cation diffusion facilitator family transporter